MNHWWYMSKIFFTSDQHFGHKNVITYCKRPFTSVDEMNRALIQNHNDVVAPNDTIYILGDFSLSKVALPLVRRLNGKKHLIMGNHDHCHPSRWKGKLEKIDRMITLYIDAGFMSVVEQTNILIAGKQVEMHHMPYTGDHHDSEARFMEYRPKNQGKWLLHGHVHEIWRVKDKQINVGVDVWDYRPVSLEVIEGIIKS